MKLVALFLLCLTACSSKNTKINYLCFTPMGTVQIEQGDERVLDLGNELKLNINDKRTVFINKILCMGVRDKE